MKRNKLKSLRLGIILSNSERSIALFALYLFALIFSGCKTAPKNIESPRNAGSAHYNICLSKGYIISNESKIVKEIQRAEVEVKEGQSRNFLLARLKEPRPEIMPKEILLESLFSGAVSSVLKNEKLICQEVQSVEKEFSKIELLKPIYVQSTKIDFSQGHTVFMIGSRSKNRSKRDFVPTLNEYIKEGLEVYSKFGLKGWIVYANEDYFFSFMNWNERTSMDLAFVDEKGQALQKKLETVVVPFSTLVLKGFDSAAEDSELIRLEL